MANPHSWQFTWSSQPGNWSHQCFYGSAWRPSVPGCCVPKTGNTLSREINPLSMQQASKSIKNLSKFHPSDSKPRHICQDCLIFANWALFHYPSLEKCATPDWPTIASGHQGPVGTGSWFHNTSPYHEQVDEWGFPWWHMIIPNILGTTPNTSSSFINYIPIFLMITVIPVNMLNPTWMMIESPVQITIHNPQKDRS